MATRSVNGNRRSGRSYPPSSTQSSSKGNRSILQFFKKSEARPKSNQNRITAYGVRHMRSNHGIGKETGTFQDRDDNSGALFVEDESTAKGLDAASASSDSDHRYRPLSPSPVLCDDRILNREGEERGRVEEFGAVNGYDEGQRYNENDHLTVKRRRMEPTPWTGDAAARNIPPYPSGGAGDQRQSTAPEDVMEPARLHESRRVGPFVDESDSDGEDMPASAKVSEATRNGSVNFSPIATNADSGDMSPESDELEELANNYLIAVANPPFAVDYACNETNLEEVLPQPGQMTPEALEDDVWTSVDQAVATENNVDDADSAFSDGDCPLCPICGTELLGLTDEGVSLHVNQCLDGSAPVENGDDNQSKPLEREQRSIRRRTPWAAIPRPGQQNPFKVETGVEFSAFTKLMTSNAEDSAWKAAAAQEESSRGKQAYDRICPFYKILPGFSICVDAFRYGAVEGCNAYFLSHFHSDHYMGLTSSWCHGPIYCSRVTGNLVRQQLKVDPAWVTDLDFEQEFNVPDTAGVRVTMIPANHCPGSSLFLFEKLSDRGTQERLQRILHCGDFRASPDLVKHPLLRPDGRAVSGTKFQQRIDVCYLDTTYLNPKYAFPPQDDVVTTCAEMCVRLNEGHGKEVGLWTKSKPQNGEHTHDKEKLGIIPIRPAEEVREPQRPRRLLVVIGTYSIGKERICLGIARALNCKIYASAAKQRICSCLEDEELTSRLTSNPLEAQVHMHSLMEMRAETLSDYLSSLKPHFTHIVGFRPTGWNYRPPKGLMTDNPPVANVLHSDAWKPRFSLKDLVPQRGSNKESTSFGVPYSEHSSFRELTMFCCSLRISRVIPTVNVGSSRSRERMKLWVQKWDAEKRKNGLFKVEDGASTW